MSYSTCSVRKTLQINHLIDFGKLKRNSTSVLVWRKAWSKWASSRCWCGRFSCRDICRTESSRRTTRSLHISARSCRTLNIQNSRAAGLRIFLTPQSYIIPEDFFSEICETDLPTHSACSIKSQIFKWLCFGARNAGQQPHCLSTWISIQSCLFRFRIW